MSGNLGELLTKPRSSFRILGNWVTAHPGKWANIIHSRHPDKHHPDIQDSPSGGMGKHHPDIQTVDPNIKKDYLFKSHRQAKQLTDYMFGFLKTKTDIDISKSVQYLLWPFQSGFASLQYQ